MMWTGCLVCCGSTSFHWQQFCLCWGLIFFFFSPAGPSVIYVHYLVSPNSDLFVLFWRVLQVHHRKVCSCMCRLIVLSKDHCSESGGSCASDFRKEKADPGSVFTLAQWWTAFYFSFHNPDTQLLISAVRQYIVFVWTTASRQPHLCVPTNKRSHCCPKESVWVVVMEQQWRCYTFLCLTTCHVLMTLTS